MKPIFDIPRTAMEVFNLLPEGTRCEVIDNTIYMSPSPTTDHQKMLLRIARKLSELGEDTEMGQVFISPCDVYLSDDMDVVQPDLLFISNSRINLIAKKGILGAPDLIIELLSSNSSYDKKMKFELYQKNLVPEYVIIDPETKEVWHYLIENGFYKRVESVNSELHLRALNANLVF